MILTNVRAKAANRSPSNSGRSVDAAGPSSPPVVSGQLGGTSHVVETYKTRSGIPEDVALGIAQSAAAKYPNDDEMQKSVIDSETEDYCYLRDYTNKQIPEKVLGQIRQVAVS